MTAQEKTQAQELADAAKEHRQPICVYCKKPLDVVAQTQYEYILWVWNETDGLFHKSDSSFDGTGDADKPYHQGCEAQDNDFVESGEATHILGLEY